MNKEKLISKIFSILSLVFAILTLVGGYLVITIIFYAMFKYNKGIF